MSEMEPAPTDLDWLKMERHNARPSGWVRRVKDQTLHACAPPMERGGPAGHAGDLWRCECGGLWQHFDWTWFSGVRTPRHEWRPASWWLRLRYGGRRGAVLDPLRPGVPPRGPSGVSLGADGSR